MISGAEDGTDALVTGRPHTREECNHVEDAHFTIEDYLFICFIPEARKFGKMVETVAFMCLYYNQVTEVMAE